VTHAPYKYANIAGQLLLLGTGTSVGVPTIGCGCAVCSSPNPKNNRTRTSAVLGLPGGNLLIDSSPDLRTQLLREKIGVVHGVVYTHEHADHLFGLDDLRLMQFYLGGPLPIYCEEKVEHRIRKSFDYAFASIPNLHSGAVPKLEFRRIGLKPFDVLGATLTPVRLTHGPNFQTLGFRIGDVAYCTDTSAVPPESMAKLGGLDTLVLDALRPEPHRTHLSLNEALAVSTMLAPRQTYFTHMSHELEHEATNAILPPNVKLAYDGLRVSLV